MSEVFFTTQVTSLDGSDEVSIQPVAVKPARDFTIQVECDINEIFCLLRLEQDIADISAAGSPNDDATKLYLRPATIAEGASSAGTRAAVGSEPTEAEAATHVATKLQTIMHSASTANHKRLTDGLAPFESEEQIDAAFNASEQIMVAASALAYHGHADNYKTFASDANTSKLAAMNGTTGVHATLAAQHCQAVNFTKGNAKAFVDTADMPNNGAPSLAADGKGGMFAALLLAAREGGRCVRTPEHTSGRLPLDYDSPDKNQVTVASNVFTFSANGGTAIPDLTTLVTVGDQLVIETDSLDYTITVSAVTATSVTAGSAQTDQAATDVKSVTKNVLETWQLAMRAGDIVELYFEVDFAPGGTAKVLTVRNGSTDYEIPAAWNGNAAGRGPGSNIVRGALQLKQSADGACSTAYRDAMQNQPNTNDSVAAADLFKWNSIDPSGQEAYGDVNTAGSTAQTA